VTKVLVTGADGFIGSHLVELLHASGYEVRALALYNSFDSRGWLDDAACRDEIEVVLGDVRDPQSCDVAVRGVDIVFHLASLIAIPYSYIAIDSYVETNIQGTLNVCKAALEHGVARVVHVSTSEVYGTARYVPIDESHPLQPQSPYSASKIGADALAMSFHHAFALPLTIARPFNTYGPRQSARAVIPTIITQILSGIDAVRLGAIHPRRDFNFVEDTCAGMLAIARADGVVGDVVNIGSGQDWSVAEVFEMICAITGSAATYELEEQRTRPKASEVDRLLCDSTKLRTLTGFRPRIALEDGLSRTIEWLTEPANLVRYRPNAYVV
jgi:NAD dependent epimerase/dehydratase